MNKNLTQEVTACLPRGKTRFDYFKDRYALLLLSYIAGKATNIGSLRRSRYARLLDKPSLSYAPITTREKVSFFAAKSAHSQPKRRLKFPNCQGFPKGCRFFDGVLLR